MHSYLLNHIIIVCEAETVHNNKNTDNYTN